MDILTVELKQIVPGMILAEDVYSRSREKLLLRNTILNTRSIAKMRVHGINKVTVIIPKNFTEQLGAKDLHLEHLNKTKSSMEFKKFRKTYLDTTTNLKNYFMAYLDEKEKNKNFSYDSLLKIMEKILTESSNSMRTFEMLQCMREYDDLTYVHSLNTSLIARALGGWLSFPEQDIELLTIAGLVHDIGKILIPNEIINKPGTLTDEEYKLVKSHPMMGFNILQGTDLDTRIKETVLMHHERCDGSGYPSNLVADNISPYAKIIAIADVYDAMTANRVYRQGICPFDVVESFENDGYTKYDVAYLMTFLQNIVQSYIHAPVLLSNSLNGEVVMINKDNLSKPIVNVNGTFFDLSKTPDLRIVCIL